MTKQKVRTLDGGEMVVPEDAQARALMTTGDSMFFDAVKFEFAQRVAKVFASSSMVPDHFKNNVGNCMIALNLADRMKCDPFMLLQNMYIVHGKPGIEAKLAIALVNATGKFTPLQYQYNKNKSACFAYATRTSTQELCEGTTVTLDMAAKEGWTSKAGSKWKTMPDLMLMYRSAMFFARAFCPEALLGMQSREELQDAVEMVQTRPGAFAQPATTEDITDKILNGKHSDIMSEADRDMGKAQDVYGAPELVEHIKNSEMKENVVNQNLIHSKSDLESQNDLQPTTGVYDQSNWVRLRHAGFKTFIDEHIDEVYAAPQMIQDKLLAKWGRLFAGDPFPVKSEIKTEVYYDPNDEFNDVRRPTNDNTRRSDAETTNGMPGDEIDANKGTTVELDLTDTNEFLELMTLQNDHPEIYRAVMNGTALKTVEDVKDAVARVDAAVDASSKPLGG